MLLTSKIQFRHPGYQITSFVYPQFKIWPLYRPAKHLSSKSALLEQSWPLSLGPPHLTLAAISQCGIFPEKSKILKLRPILLANSMLASKEGRERQCRSFCRPCSAQPTQQLSQLNATVFSISWLYHWVLPPDWHPHKLSAQTLSGSLSSTCCFQLY